MGGDGCQVACQVNSVLVMTYWSVGKRVLEDVLKNKRANYGEQIVATLRCLSACHGIVPPERRRELSNLCLFFKRKPAHSVPVRKNSLI